MGMNRMGRFAVVLVAVAAVASPAAFAGRPPGSPGKSTADKPPAHKPPGAGLPGPGASQAAKAKAYGRYCQNQSRRHVAGQKDTPFSQCVTAMASLATGQTSSSWAACSALSRKHVASQTGAPFSRCVVAGAKLLKDQHKKVR
jgi:hypothetical protein